MQGNMAELPISKAIVKFNSHSQARDKIYRIIQYGSRLAVWYITRKSQGGTMEEKLKNLEAALALSRKLFRMGNSLELIQKAMESLSITDVTLQRLAVSANSLKALWLILDHVIWCGKIKLVQIDIAMWNKWSAWAWLVGLAASTLYDVIKLNQLQNKLDNALLQMDVVGRHDLADPIKLEMHVMRLGFWRDICDLFIPLSSLQFVNPGLGALCGVVSSCVGFRLEWEKHVQPFKLR